MQILVFYYRFFNLSWLWRGTNYTQISDATALVISSSRIKARHKRTNERTTDQNQCICRGAGWWWCWWCWSDFGKSWVDFSEKDKYTYIYMYFKTWDVLFQWHVSKLLLNRGWIICTVMLLWNQPSIPNFRYSIDIEFGPRRGISFKGEEELFHHCRDCSSFLCVTICGIWKKTHCHLVLQDLASIKKIQARNGNLFLGLNVVKRICNSLLGEICFEGSHVEPGFVWNFCWNYCGAPEFHWHELNFGYQFFAPGHVRTFGVSTATKWTTWVVGWKRLIQ